MTVELKEIQIQLLETHEQLKEASELERKVWGDPVIPTHRNLAVVRNGGFLLGAYLDQKLIGFTYGFPGYRDGSSYFYSHMMGLDTHHRHLGLGSKLKWRQKDEAIARGYQLISWTYDPLETVNARLNLHKLNAIGAVYKPDYYGSMEDSLNSGVPTDRFLVEWWICSNHLDQPVKHLDLSNDLTRKFGGSPRLEKTLALEEEHGVIVQIPDHFQEIKKRDLGEALAWRHATRDVFLNWMNQGFVAVDLVRDATAGAAYYLFVERHKLNLTSEATS